MNKAQINKAINFAVEHAPKGALSTEIIFVNHEKTIRLLVLTSDTKQIEQLRPDGGVEVNGPMHPRGTEPLIMERIASAVKGCHVCTINYELDVKVDENGDYSFANCLGL